MTSETTRKPKSKVGVPKGYIGVAEMQELTGRTHRTICRWVAEQEAGVSSIDFPESGKFGGIRIWKRAKVMTWMENLANG